MPTLTKFSLLSVCALGLILVGCAKSISSPNSSGSAVRVRALPSLNVVQEAELRVTSTENKEGLFLTDADKQQASPVMLINYAVSRNQYNAEKHKMETLYIPVLSERHASGGSGGMLKLAEDGDIMDFELPAVQDAIANQGIQTSYDIAYRKETAFKDFSPNSIWVLSVRDAEYADGPMWQYTVVVKLIDGFTVSDDVYQVLGSKVKIQYKVLEYKKL